MPANPVIYDQKTLAFVAAALEYCTLIESAPRHTCRSFTDKALQILPLLYQKALLLPAIDEPEQEDEPERFITENTWDTVRRHMADLLGARDSFLDTFHPDIRYSDTPIAATISENLADVYQDLGDFAALFRLENETVMQQALHLCRESFRTCWGQKLLNALKALHPIRFPEAASAAEDGFITEEDEEEEEEEDAE
jgi:hypothetical protein